MIFLITFKNIKLQYGDGQTQGNDFTMIVPKHALTLNISMQE